MEEVVRGCGTRVKGGLYAETHLGKGGLPLEEFLVDEPKEISPSTFGLSKVGVTIINVGGVYHILDWIGEKYYGLPSDFIEEVRSFGLSRRLPNIKDLHLLTAESKMFMVHSKANISNPADLRMNRPEIECICGKEEHMHPYTQQCVSLLYVQNSSMNPNTQGSEANGSYSVQMPSFSYKMTESKISQHYGKFPAIFMALPIHNIAVIEDDIGGKHLDILENEGLFQTELILKKS